MKKLCGFALFCFSFGLFLIKEIAARRGGELTIETEEGEGTVITLAFTRKENETCIQ